MTGKTIAEKILSAKSDSDVRAGDVVICRIDHLVATDGSMPMTIDYFERMGGTSIANAENASVSLDHYSPPPNRTTADLHNQIRKFAQQHGMSVFEVGDGIGHQVMMETGRALPSDLVIGADSHTVTYGALNALATGVGSSDLAAAMIAGRIWLRVPETIKVNLDGTMGDKVHAKDIVLSLVKELGADGAAYKSLEFAGPGIANLDMDARALLANMSVEMGAKCGLFAVDETTRAYLTANGSRQGTPVSPDPDATYCQVVEIDLSRVEPQIALPHQVDTVVPVRDAPQAPIHMIYIGTCAGGRASDLHEALAILRQGERIAPGVQMIYTPASRTTLSQVSKDGTLAEFVEMGGVIQTAGCGSCCGTCGVIPGDGINVISTANRNFKGRMGNPEASIYLASPITCAAAALNGRITNPKDIAS
ncbi:MAG: aconitase/3-isopropylmalate dehydratase large subunit family protein [Hyphomicrobiaceae bacterium]|nr:aconitase/3-isopropylmalate dehydratase large subunit family protein [Hyphomicrobiaceae bacterium]